MSHIRLDPLELVERRFLDVDSIRRDPDGLLLCKPRKHRDEIDMGVTERACPKVSVFGLGAVVVCEDVTKRAAFRGADEGAASACVAHKEFELPGVSHQPPWQSFSVSLAALGELADDGAGLIVVLGKPGK